MSVGANFRPKPTIWIDSLESWIDSDSWNTSQKINEDWCDSDETESIQISQDEDWYDSD